MRKLLSIISVFIGLCCTSDRNRDAHIKPDLNRFEIEVVVDELNQPMSMDILKDGRILIAEKEGAIKLYNPEDHSIKEIGKIEVNSRFSVPYTTSGGPHDADDGMHGIVADPDFEKNGFIYFYYSPATAEPKSEIARYRWDGDKIDLSSKNVYLEWETQRNRCCHWGGGMVFDKDRNLLIAVGDNSGFNIKMEDGDSRRTSGNTNDLRGSILRIKPDPNGGFSIPKGNLFEEGIEGTRPEIYIMGVRNPWRLSMDSKTGWIYWGEVGPSLDEFNRAKQAGNYGWPFFIGNNEKHLNLETPYDTNHIVNDSPFNTGIKELPTPPVPALAWYDRDPSTAFPIPGSGSLSAVGGPVYRVKDFKKAKRAFPPYYDGKWFITDYVRGWILVMELDENGNYVSLEEFMPEGTFKGINDMDFGKDGDLYVLQYGHESYKPWSKEAKLIRIKYNNGNRPPRAKASTKGVPGTLPQDIELSAAGTIDYDNNIKNYRWSIFPEEGTTWKSQGENAVVNIQKPGVYRAILEVTDAENATDTDTVEIIAGNQPPAIHVDFQGSNQSIYFPGDRIPYTVTITDLEDGEIDHTRVKVWADFLPDNHNLNAFIDTLTAETTSFSAKALIGRQLMQKNNCFLCHTMDRMAAGPPYSEVRKRYMNLDTVYQYLSRKIISGSIGVWGQVEMPAHPTISREEAECIIEYILDVFDEDRLKRSLPLSGKIVVPPADNPGYLIFKAAYEDKGYQGLPSIKSVKTSVLNNHRIYMADIDTVVGMRNYIPHFKQKLTLIPNSQQASVGLYNLDLSGVKKIGVELIGQNKDAHADWKISVKIGSQENKVVLASQNLPILANGPEKDIKVIEIDPVKGKKDLFIEFNCADGKPYEPSFELRSIIFYNK